MTDNTTTRPGTATSTCMRRCAGTGTRRASLPVVWLWVRPRPSSRSLTRATRGCSTSSVVDTAAPTVIADFSRSGIDGEEEL